MAITPTQIIEGTLIQAILTAHYASPPLTSTAIQTLTVFNSTSAWHSFILYIVPQGVTPGAAQVIVQREIGPECTIVVEEAIGQIVPPDAEIQMIADVTDILAVSASGLEFT